MVAGESWWLCLHSDSIAFLPASSGAQWILYPKPPDSKTSHTYPVKATFERTFILNTLPASASLTARAFKCASVTVNGHAVGNLKCNGKDWKSPATASIAGLLQIGTNEVVVCVTNSLGPPALWLQIQSGQLSLGSDESWLVSLTGTAWKKACLATQRPVIAPWSSIYDTERTSDSIQRAWPVILLFCAMSAMAVWAATRWLPAVSASAFGRTMLIYGPLIVVLAARTLLLVNNLPKLPRPMGFDAEDHQDYIRFIQEKGALPLPSDGVEMHQPPLYYLGSALWLDAKGILVSDDDAMVPLRAVNGVVGLVHCWLAFLCFRMLFPENLPAQAVGLLVAAFLPPHLYLSQYVTNEPLNGLLVTLAFYLLLRTLETEKARLRWYIGIGAVLGAAMLTKVSSLLAVPLFAMALALRQLSLKKASLFSPRVWLQSAGVMTLACVIVCNWHYGRIWMETSQPVIGNWENTANSERVLDPAFRTSGYYLHFGEVFTSPLFSGLFSFADGIYSTLWGDGLVSGRADLGFRPPWNYDLMNIGYLLSVPISLLFIAGFAFKFLNFLRQPTTTWFVVLSLVSLFGLVIFFMTLRVSSYAQAKAFYGFPALVPFSALVAAGWSWLAQKRRILQSVLWIVVLVWTLTVYATFWIFNGNFETWRIRGMSEILQGHTTEATESLAHALELKPDDAETHLILAEALDWQNRPIEAMQHCQMALRIRPDFPKVLNELAKLLSAYGGNDSRSRVQAVKLAERACEITDYRESTYISTLAAAYANVGRLDDAIAMTQKTCDLTAETGQSYLLQKSQESLAAYLNNIAWTLATSADMNIRNGARAVQLAQHACDIIGDKQIIYVGTLSAAYAEAGRFDDAISTAEKACAMATESGEQDLLKKNQELLALYRAHKPYHEVASTNQAEPPAVNPPATDAGKPVPAAP
jgi:tetratricopeptide (TPR) repeat protein